MESLPIADGALDGWISLNTVYFVEDLPTAFAELRRVLAPSGRGVLGIADPEWMAQQAFTKYTFTVRPVTDVVAALSRRRPLGRATHHAGVCSLPTPGLPSGLTTSRTGTGEVNPGRSLLPLASVAAPSHHPHRAHAHRLERDLRPASHRHPSDVKGRVRGVSRSVVFRVVVAARVASLVRVREVADPKCRCAGASRPRWICVTPRGALPDPPPPPSTAAFLASVRSWRYSASEIRRFRQRIASARVLPAASLRR